MSRWFRFYAEALRNPKVLRLSDYDFRLWVKMLAVAAENDGTIPALKDLKMVLSARLDRLSQACNRLITGGLIDPLEVGYEPHNWSKFQYKSDTSTDRVHKFRGKRNVSETPPETETEKISEPNGSLPALQPGHVLEAYNEMAERNGLPVAKRMTKPRSVAVRGLIRDYVLDDFVEAIAAIERSTFLRGEGRNGWSANFDFMIRRSNFQKLIEGNYDRPH